MDYEDLSHEARLQNMKRIQDRTVDELLGICRGMLSDGEINRKEAEYLREWFRKNEVYVPTIFQSIEAKVSYFLDEEIDNRKAHDELIDLLKRLTGEDKDYFSHGEGSTSFLLDEPEIVEFEGKEFVFTGKFTSARSRKDLMAIVKEKGGRVNERGVTYDTDYLVVGEGGSSQWAHSALGRKLEDAIKKRESGGKVRIISEVQFMKYV